jgi:hypothetical protein
MKITMHSLIKGWIPAFAACLLGWIRVWAGRRRENDPGKIDSQNQSARSRLRQGYQKILHDGDAGEGRMICCMQAHEAKISPQCDYELDESASSVQSTADSLKDAIIACKAEITGVCGKTVPGQGRIAASLMANRSAASKGCEEAIQRVEAAAAQ